MQAADLPPHTSCSALNTYASCPRRFAYRYLEHREPEVRGVGMALGSAVHSTLAWWFEERVQEREPALEELLRVLRADLAASTAYDNMRWGDTTPAKIDAEAERLVRLFVAEKGHLAVKECEVRFDLLIIDPDTGEEMPRALLGFFDFELGTSGNVVELKTAKRAFTPIELRAGLQFSGYRTAARYMGVDVEVLTLVRTKTPRMHHKLLPRDRDVSRWFMKAASQIERSILAGQFPPAPGRTCSYCEYRRACLGVEARDAEVADVEAA